jgi:hypothetical protein
MATALPFALALLALALARLRRGVSPRSWRLVRAGFVALACYPALSWLMAGPLCSTLNAAEGADLCDGTWSVQVPLVPAIVAAAVVVTLAVMGRRWLDRWDDPERPALPGGPSRMAIDAVVAVVTVLGVAVVGVAVGRSRLGQDLVLSIGSTALMAALWALIAIPAVALALTARSPRRLVGGVLLAAIAFGLLLFPTAAAVLVRPDIPYLAQSLLPTWETSFQFEAGPGGLPAAIVILGAPSALIMGAAFVLIERMDRRAAS